jgi:hypothetical protein
MDLFSFRMKDGNCVVIYAKDESSAMEVLTGMGLHSTAAGVRIVTTFVANFALTDTGDLHTTLLDRGTLQDFASDYPLLHAAQAHSYADFDDSRAEGASEPVLFNDLARQDAHHWDRRDKNVVAFAVQQERQRLSD